MMTQYVLADDSASDEVVVGDKVLTKNGEPVDLTEEEYKNATADEYVKLEEAGAADEQPAKEEASEQPPKQATKQATEQTEKE